MGWDGGLVVVVQESALRLVMVVALVRVIVLCLISHGASLHESIHVQISKDDWEAHIWKSKKKFNNSFLFKILGKV